MSRYLADLSVVVEGIDLSPGMISAARLHHPDLAFVVGSISDLAYEDDSFDGVMLWYSTIHTVGDRQQRLYSEASRVLKRGATCSSAPRPVQACTTPRLPTVATATTSTWSAPVHCR